MTYSFHHEAELEFNDAIDYYEDCISCFWLNSG